MPKGFPTLAGEQKQEIIKSIKEKGERVSELAKEYGVVPQTIYNLLSRQAHSTGALLELAKVKRQRKKPFKSKDLNQPPSTIPNLVTGLAIEMPNQVWVIQKSIRHWENWLKESPGRSIIITTSESIQP